MSDKQFNIFEALFEHIEREMVNLGSGIDGLHGDDKDIFDIITDNIKKGGPLNFDNGKGLTFISYDHFKKNR